MKIQFYNSNPEYKEVIDMLKSNHPDYDTEVLTNTSYIPKNKNSIVAKIGEKHFEANTPEEMYEKIVDHFFRLPNCFIG